MGQQPNSTSSRTMSGYESSESNSQGTKTKLSSSGTSESDSHETKTASGGSEGAERTSDATTGGASPVSCAELARLSAPGTSASATAAAAAVTFDRPVLG